MKKIVMITIVFALANAVAMAADPMRVALLDFVNQASAPSDSALVGNVQPQSIADNGVNLLAKILANKEGYVLIDRREFIKQIQDIKLKDKGKTTNIKPSFLRAAQAVNADIVLRGNLMSYSAGKRTINLGGIKTEFIVLKMRVSLEALDTRDGTVVAMTDGVGKIDVRQSKSDQTVLGEDELVQLMQTALEKAIPGIDKSLQARAAKQRKRPTVKLSVKSDADPALVEIDGMLIGTTPLVNFQTYAGDHVLTVGKAGYRDVSKHILLKVDTKITVPLFRTKLSAEEMKQILEKGRLNIIAGIPEPVLIIDIGP